MDGPTQEGHVWYSRRASCLAIRGGEDDKGSWFQTIAGNSMRPFNEATNVRVVDHVDDFLCTGPERGLANLRRCLQNKHVIKFEILGAGANEKKAGKFLGRAQNGLNMV